MSDWHTWALAVVVFIFYVVRRFERFRAEDARSDRRNRLEEADWERTRLALEASRRSSSTDPDSGAPVG